MNEVIVRIRYAKEYPANCIGHLDTVAAIQRSMRMASWPLKFSCGFNPRIKISFTPSLSLGFMSEAEYVDVCLTCRLEEYQIKKFHKSTIEGIRIMEVRTLFKEEAGLNEVLAGVRYRIEVNDPEKAVLETSMKVVEVGKNYIIVDIFETNGGFKNPLKLIALEIGTNRVRKIMCHWKTDESECCQMDQEKRKNSNFV